MDDNKYTRVSTLIRHLTNYSNISKSILQNKAEIGKFVHKQISDLLEIYNGSEDGELSPEVLAGKIKEVENSSLSKSDVLFYMRAFYNLCQEVTLINTNHLAIEKRYYDNEYMISGQIDLLTERDDKVLLIDWKTTAMFNEIANSVQMYLYKKLVEENEGIAVDECYIVQLLGHGSFNIHRINFKKYGYIAEDILSKHLLTL